MSIGAIGVYQTYSPLQLNQLAARAAQIVPSAPAVPSGQGATPAKPISPSIPLVQLPTDTLAMLSGQQPLSPEDAREQADLQWADQFTSFVSKMFGTDQWSGNNTAGAVMMALAEKHGIHLPPDMNPPVPDSSEADIELNGGAVKIKFDIGPVSTYDDVEKWLSGQAGSHQSLSDLQTQIFGNIAQSGGLARSAEAKLEAEIFGGSANKAAKA